MPRNWTFANPMFERFVGGFVSVVAVTGMVVAPIIANAANPAFLLSGQVTEGSGIDPVADAVVSLELGLAPNGVLGTDAKLPSKLAVWQVRTGADGRFAVPAPADLLVLPHGTKLAGARLKVFALTYAAYESRAITLNVKMVGADRIKLHPSATNMQIRLASERQDDPWITAQLEAMYQEAHLGTRAGASASSQRQAIDSYRPLLSLLAASCYQIELLGARLPVPCQKANTEFDLRRSFPPEITFVRKESERPAPPQPKPAMPTVIKGSPPESPSQGTLQQRPPSD